MSEAPLFLFRQPLQKYTCGVHLVYFPRHRATCTVGSHGGWGVISETPAVLFLSFNKHTKNASLVS